MAYLWVHFTGEHPEGEQVYFSVSPDGLHWTDLGQGPVLESNVGEMGVRDPFLIRNPLDGRVYLIATDLRIANGKGWGKAQFEGSTAIVVWSSDDLVHWTGPDRVRLPEIAALGAGCAWAPEAMFDEEKQACMMYWASMIEGKQRIFAAWTRDFHTFTQVRQLIEKQGHIIDVTMARENGSFYRFSACADAPGILMEKGDSLCDTSWERCYAQGVPGTEHTEGPIILYLEEKKAWCLYVDDIGHGGGYTPYCSDTLSQADFARLDAGAYDFGARKKRHGGILAMTQKEYDGLLEAYGAYERRG